MAFDASGTFTRSAGVDSTGATVWQDDATAGIKILADRHDTHDQDLANGLSQCLLRNGSGVPTAHTPWGGFKITNLANPTAAQDAATKHYADNPDAAITPRNIAGADLNGRLNFTAASGVNGITWTYANLAWVARHSKAGEASDRLVMTPTNAPSTATVAAGLADVFVIDDAGRINNSGVLSHNSSYDGSAWRTISPGFGTYITYTNGVLAAASNDVATITNNYATFTPRTFFYAQNAAGSSVVVLPKSASGKTSSIRGMNGSELRWNLELGNSTAESSTHTGSDFALTAYDNNGLNPLSRLTINRLTGDATFAGDVYSAQQFNSTTATAVLSAINGGQILLRPNGPTSTVEQVEITALGDLVASKNIYAGTASANGGGTYAGLGLRGRAGSAGAYGSFWQNFNWNGSVLTAYAGTSILGNLSFTCDYRIKKDIAPLGSMWDRVKALNPISYTQRAYEVWTDEDDVRWGFLAHELQEQLAPTAASGVKDGPEVQSPNLLAIVAGLTKALQEAMSRIEALEAA